MLEGKYRRNIIGNISYKNYANFHQPSTMLQNHFLYNVDPFLPGSNKSLQNWMLEIKCTVRGLMLTFPLVNNRYLDAYSVIGTYQCYSM